MLTAERDSRRLIVLTRPAVPAKCLECTCLIAGWERAKRRQDQAASRMAGAEPDSETSHSAVLQNLVQQTRMSSLMARLELLKHQNLHRLQAARRLPHTPKRHRVSLFVVN